MIRPATHSDIPRILELGALLHASSSYRDQEFLPEKAGSFIGSLIDGDGVVFVAEIDGEVVGGIAGGLAEQWFSDARTAFDWSVFIDPTRRSGITATKLMSAFEHWAKARGASQIHIGITTNLNADGTARFYRSIGYVDGGQLFVKEI